MKSILLVLFIGFLIVPTLSYAIQDFQAEDAEGKFVLPIKEIFLLMLISVAIGVAALKTVAVHEIARDDFLNKEVGRKLEDKKKTEQDSVKIIF